MTELGFFSAARGYWQTTGEPGAKRRSKYPDDTTEVPLRPSPTHEWNGSAWVDNPPPPKTDAELEVDAADRVRRTFGDDATPELKAMFGLLVDFAVAAGLASSKAQARTVIAQRYRSYYVEAVKAQRGNS